MKYLKLLFFTVVFHFSPLAQCSEKKPADKVTFGWEVEFSDDRERASIPGLYSGVPAIDPVTKTRPVDADPANGSITKGDKFPLKVREKGGIDESGNIEFVSEVYREGDTVQNLAQAIGDMERMKGILEKDQLDIKSFHLHMRFDKNEKVDLGDFNSYLAVISDFIFSYRLKYLQPRYALYNYTQKRSSPDGLHRRGVLRVISDDSKQIKGSFKGEGKQLDVEIRGLLGKVDLIKFLADAIAQFAINPPAKVKKLQQSVMLHYGNGFDPIFSVNEYRKLKGLPLIDKSSADNFRKAIYASVYARGYYNNLVPSRILSNRNALLPLMGIEFHPLLLEKERKLIKEANGGFIAKLSALYDNKSIDLTKIRYDEDIFRQTGALLPKTGQKVLESFSREIQEQLKSWAIKSNYHGSIKNMISYDRISKLFDPDNVLKRNAKDSNYLIFLIFQYIGGLPKNELSPEDLETQKFYNNDFFKDAILAIDRESFSKHVKNLDGLFLRSLKIIVRGTDLEALVNDELGTKCRKKLESVESSLKSYAKFKNMGSINTAPTSNPDDCFAHEVVKKLDDRRNSLLEDFLEKNGGDTLSLDCSE